MPERKHELMLTSAVQRVGAATVAGKVEWSRGSDTDDRDVTFVTRVAGYILVVFENSRAERYEFVIKTVDGDVVDWISSETCQYLGQLHAEVRRRVMLADEAIESILVYLGAELSL